MSDNPKSYVVDDSGSPVNAIENVDNPKKLEDGIALCLSGGGYRAMVFHAGVLQRLNQSGYLKRVTRISSVSGGSIAAGVLGAYWNKLEFDPHGVAVNFPDLVLGPIRLLAAHTIDVGSILSGVFGPGTVSDRIADAYRKYLFPKTSFYRQPTLQDLPDSPRFVFNATNIQSKSLWRFSKPYMRDWRVGKVNHPTIELAVAIGASSAFPPVLSPVELDLDPNAYEANSGTGLQKAPFTTRVVLTDGGVYDNMGLETVWKRYKTILVSDAGGMYAEEADPERDWFHHTCRVYDLIDNQVRSLRKRQVIDSFKAGTRKGAYWGIWSNINRYPAAAKKLSCPITSTSALAGTPTRLKGIDQSLQDRLMNWGYAICDAAMRTHVEPQWPEPEAFPNAGAV